MKKLRNVLISFIVFLIYNMKSYATVSDEYAVSKTGTSGKIIFLFIGILLVAIVLFIGYKMDKMEEIHNRKKKYNIKNSFENGLKSILEKIAELKKRNNKDDSEDFLETYENEEHEVFDDESDKSEPEEYIENEEIDEIDEEEIIDRKIESPELDNISAIFNTPVFNDEENKNDEDDVEIGVKGYDFNKEDDWDELLDIQKTISEANIKRYTRKKDNAPKQNKLQEEIKKPKRYTRKIINDEPRINMASKLEDDSNVEDIKPIAKRGKKPKDEKESDEISVKSLPKSKRGRKPSSKKESKPKKETKPKSKPKTKTESKPKAKRGRKPKVMTQEEELRMAIDKLPKSRRGRKPKSN